MKWLKKLFILSLFIPIFMFKNTSAVNYSVDLVPIKSFNVTWNGQVRVQGESWTDTTFPADIPIPSSSTDIITKSRQVGGIWTRNKFSVTEGNYYEILIEIRSNPSATQFTEQIMPLGYWENFQSNNDFEFITIDQILDYTDPVLGDHCQSSVSNPTVCDPDGVIAFDPSYFYQSQWFKVLLRAKHTGSYYVQFGNKEQTTFLVSPSRNSVAIPIRFRPLAVIVEYKGSNTAEQLEEMNEKDEQDRSDIESQSSSTEGEADSAGNAAESTGTSLFSAFAQLLTALTSVNGNSCTLPRMQVYSLDFGQMNLCQFNIPPQIMGLVSIGMVFIIVPLGINLVKRMISLYKEITG